MDTAGGFPLSLAAGAWVVEARRGTSISDKGELSFADTFGGQLVALFGRSLANPE
jgi:hypothetical protein